MTKLSALTAGADLVGWLAAADRLEEQGLPGADLWRLRAELLGRLLEYVKSPRPRCLKTVGLAGGETMLFRDTKHRVIATVWLGMRAADGFMRQKFCRAELTHKVVARPTPAYLRRKVFDLVNDMKEIINGKD